MSKKFKGKLCVYCGEMPSIKAGDHIFPREFFLEHERGNLPKVPACDSCNNEKSKLEHYLTAVLPFGARHKDSQEQLTQRVPKRLQRNKRLQRMLKVGQTKGIEITPDGRREVTTAIPLDGSRYETFFEYAAVGLLWHHWGEILDKKAVIFSLSLTPTGESLFQKTFDLFRKQPSVEEIIGENTVKYTGCNPAHIEHFSVWKFRFYGGLVVMDENGKPEATSSSVGVMTGPESSEEKLAKLLETQPGNR